MRRHGLQWPPNLHQVGLLITLIALIGLFYVVSAPALQRTTLLWLIVRPVYAAVAAATVFLLVVASAIDPTEPNSRQGKKMHPEQAEEQNLEYCRVCEVGVRPASKHCRRCDRCTEGFDHHCAWLNNCVGARNYGWFLTLLLVAALLAALHSGVACAAFVWAFTSRARVYAATQHGLLPSVPQAFLATKVLNAASAVLGICLLALLLHLIAFHLMICAKGLTTYDFLTAQQEQPTGGCVGCFFGGRSGGQQSSASSKKRRHQLRRVHPLASCTELPGEAEARRRRVQEGESTSQLVDSAEQGASVRDSLGRSIDVVERPPSRLSSAGGAQGSARFQAGGPQDRQARGTGQKAPSLQSTASGGQGKEALLSVSRTVSPDLGFGRTSVLRSLSPGV